MNNSIEQRVTIMSAVIDFLISAESLLENVDSAITLANHREAINDLRKLEKYSDIPDYQEVCHAGIHAYMHLHKNHESVFKFTEQEIFTRFIQSPIRGINNLVMIYKEGYAFI